MPVGLQLPVQSRHGGCAAEIEEPQPIRKRKAEDCMSGTSSSVSTSASTHTFPEDGGAVDPAMLEEVGQLCAVIGGESAEPAELLKALTLLRESFATSAHPPIPELLACGGGRVLAERLRSDSPSALARTEAAWVLTNAAAGASLQTMALVEAGAHEAAMVALASPGAAERHDLCDQCLWLLGNIAGDGDVALRDALFAAGVMEALGLLFMQMPAFSWSVQERAQVLRTLTWLMGSLCRGIPAPALADVECCFDYFAQVLMGSDDAQMLHEALWGLCYLMEGASNEEDCSARAERILSIDFGEGEARDPAEPHPLLSQVVCFARRAAQDLRSPLRVPALRLLGLLVATTVPEVTDAAVASGAVQAFRLVLRDAKASDAVRRDAAWALSNIAAGTKDQAVAVLSDAAASDALFAVVEQGASHAVRRESAWAVVALATQLGFEAQGAVALDARRVLALATAMLRDDRGEAALQRALLDAAELVLRHGDGVARAQGLKANPMVRLGEEVGLLDELEELLRGSEPGLQRKAQLLTTRFGAGPENRLPDKGGSFGSKTPQNAAWGTPSAISGGSPTRRVAYRFGA